MFFYEKVNHLIVFKKEPIKKLPRYICNEGAFLLLQAAFFIVRRLLFRRFGSGYILPLV